MNVAVIQLNFMQTRNLKPRIAQLLANESEDSSRKIAEVVRQNISEAEAKMPSAVRTLLALCAGFVVLVSTKGVAISLGSISFSNIEPVTKVLPALVAFVYYSIVALHFRRMTLTWAYTELVCLLYTSDAADE